MNSKYLLASLTFLLISIILSVDLSRFLSDHLSGRDKSISNYEEFEDTEVIPIVGAVGPESIAFDPITGDGPYTGVSDGRIIKWDQSERRWINFAVTSPKRDGCEGSHDHDVTEYRCGRPLGLGFNERTRDLYIADAYMGLLVVGPNGGLATKIAAQSHNIPFKFTNALDIDQSSGVVYFTDSSSIYQRRNRFGPIGGFALFSSSSPDNSEVLGSSRLVGWKGYEEYRRALYGGNITHKALLVDAVGTLVIPSQPMAQIYRQIGEKYGVNYSEDEILNRYRRAYEQPWGRSRLRYVNDGRPFWQYIVSSSTGCSDSQYFEELYNYYTTEKAWHLCDPNAEKVFMALRKAGVKIAVVSNFDTRLRPLLRALNCDHWFDAVAVSAEVAAEKPNPMIFLGACELLDVKPEDAVHVGDDRRNDIWGARDAGCDAWLWGSDVHSFKEVAQRIGVQV